MRDAPGETRALARQGLEPVGNANLALALAATPPPPARKVAAQGERVVMQVRAFRIGFNADVVAQRLLTPLPSSRAGLPLARVTTGGEEAPGTAGGQTRAARGTIIFVAKYKCQYLYKC